MGDGADEELAVGTGPADDEVAPVSAGTADVGEGGARGGGGNGGGADAADVIESNADVGRLGLNKMVAGMASVGEASQAMEGEAVSGEDDFGGAGGGDAGAAVMATGSRVVWTGLGPGWGLRHDRMPSS